MTAETAIDRPEMSLFVVGRALRGCFPSFRNRMRSKVLRNGEPGAVWGTIRDTQSFAASVLDSFGHPSNGSVQFRTGMRLRSVKPGHPSSQNQFWTSIVTRCARVQNVGVQDSSRIRYIATMMSPPQRFPYTVEPAAGRRPPVAPCKRRAERSEARCAPWGNKPPSILRARRRAGERMGPIFETNPMYALQVRFPVEHVAFTNAMLQGLVARVRTERANVRR